MFPFPSRIRHGIYRYEGEAYALPLNEAKRDNSIHGFVAGQAFELVGQHSNELEASMTFRYVHDGSYPGYPFPFDLRINYTLMSYPAHNSSLQVRYEVLNTGAKAAPLGFGWHPYFTLGEEPIDNLTIDLPVSKQITLDENLLPVGEELFSRQGAIPLHNRTLDAAFLVEESSDGSVTTVLRSSQQKLQLNVWQEIGPGKVNYLVVYTPLKRDNIAIEPLTCNVNALNNGQGLIVLQPGETTNGTVRVSLS
jgi:aldose 1-epimerase